MLIAVGDVTLSEKNVTEISRGLFSVFLHILVTFEFLSTTDSRPLITI